jgi:hypothetical protein
VAAKAFVSMTPCLLCLYVNGVMLFSLCRRPAFLESSRYLLFGHLLLQAPPSSASPRSSPGSPPQRQAEAKWERTFPSRSEMGL